ncbi:MAG TPA: hypothetical protein VN611_03580, partial [Patescibacteria group bacterium]|nr:hypothetical protein [Patescibacteria group bacterium]
MKRLSVITTIFALVALCFCLIPPVAQANLDDNRATIAAQYGDYRLVIDTDNQKWTKDQWESKGKLRAKASSYTYRFRRGDMGFDMVVEYDSDLPNANVKSQRFTPDASFQVKDFKNYFPEIQKVLALPDTKMFAVVGRLSSNFKDVVSPVAMGAVVQGIPSDPKAGQCQLVAFNAMGQGELLKELKEISKDSYIREFVVERVSRQIARERLQSRNIGDW